MGWPAALVEGGEGGSQGGKAECVSLQHIVRSLQHSLILTSASPRVICPFPTVENDSIRMVTVRWGLMEGKVESRSEVLEPSAKQEAGLQDIGHGAHLGCGAQIYAL